MPKGGPAYWFRAGISRILHGLHKRYCRGIGLPETDSSSRACHEWSVIRYSNELAVEPRRESTPRGARCPLPGITAKLPTSGKTMRSNLRGNHAHTLYFLRKTSDTDVPF